MSIWKRKLLHVPSVSRYRLIDEQSLNQHVLLAKAFPKTSTEQPIYLYSNDDNNVQLPQQLELPKFPVFPPNVSVENDASLAKVIL